MRTFMPTDLVLDRSLAGPLGPNTQAEIESLLSRLYGLRPDDREVIGAAIELHYAATLLYDVEANAAYALIIAGLERLSRAYGVAPAEWSYWEHAGRLDQAFSELALSKVQINRLRDELLKDQHLRLRQTFAGYVVESLPDEYWQEQIEDFVPGLIVQPNGAMKFEKWKAEPGIPMSRFVPSDRALLRKRLLRSYDVRSSYVHKGTRRAGLTATAAQAVGKKPSTTAPIEFVGVRTMLRTLIFHETTNRTQPITLPKVIMMHGTQRDQT